MMATDNPRIQVMLDKDINGMLAGLAARRGASLSATAAALIREALELQEDVALSAHGDARLRSVQKWVAHTDAWGE
jgi:hypothetical protein